MDQAGKLKALGLAAVNVWRCRQSIARGEPGWTEADVQRRLDLLNSGCQKYDEESNEEFERLCDRVDKGEMMMEEARRRMIDEVVEAVKASERPSMEPSAN